MKTISTDMSFALPVWIGLSAEATLAPSAHVVA
jgi:hypothetical protein